MKRRPQGELVLATLVQPIETAREIRLSGNGLDVFDVSQPSQRVSIPGSHQSLAPRREEDSPAMRGLPAQPGHETLQRRLILSQPRVGLRALGKRAIRAAV